MSLADQLSADLKQAQLNKHQAQVDLLRLIKAACENEAIRLKKKDEGLSDNETLAVLKREVRKRKDAIEQFTKGGRPELANKEKEELELIQKYLPAELNEDKIRAIVTQVILTMGKPSPSQFGQVMAAAMAKLKGQADGAVVSKVVKEILNR